MANDYGYSSMLQNYLAQAERQRQIEEAQNAQKGAIVGQVGDLGGKYLAGKLASKLFDKVPENAIGQNIDGSYILADEAAATPFMGVGTLPAAGIAAGTYLGAKSLFDLLQGNKDNSLQGKAGRVTLGIATGGLSEVARKLFGGNGNKYQTEANRLKDLQSSGVNIPQALIDEMPQKGRSIDELINKNYAPDFVGFTPLKTWVNNKFASSRNEGDLRPEDVVNYAAFSEKFGNDFASSPLEKRLQVAKMALDAQALNEHHGTIDFNDQLNADLETKIKNYLANNTNDKTKVSNGVKITFK